MANTTYLILALTGLPAGLILNNMESQLHYVALGFGVIMLLFGIFCKGKVEVKEEVEVKSSKDDNADADNLNENKGGQ